MFRHQCRTCGSRHLRRSHTRNLAESYALPVILLRPFRCTECKERQYKIGFHRFRSAVGNTLMSIALLAGIALILIFIAYLGLHALSQF